nr:response regulator [Bdellovibrionales bacterium]
DFEVVLMDIQMPRVDGYQATTRLRAAGFTKPIIALTAHALNEERERCLKTGCNSHLTKPIDRRQLIQSLIEIM